MKQEGQDDPGPCLAHLSLTVHCLKHILKICKSIVSLYAIFPNQQHLLTITHSVPSSIPSSPSLSDKTLSCGPVFLDVLNQNHCRLSLQVLPDMKLQKKLHTNPPGSVLVTVMVQPQKKLRGFFEMFTLATGA